MMRTLTLLFLFVSVAAISQNYCSVVANQEDKKPLEGASVYLLAADSAVISYQYTTAEGKFCLPASKNGRRAVYLSVSYIGFTPIQMPVESFQEDMTLWISPAVTKPREVAVNSRRIRMAIR